MKTAIKYHKRSLNRDNDWSQNLKQSPKKTLPCADDKDVLGTLILSHSKLNLIGAM